MAGWNQTQADWAMMLGLGCAWGIAGDAGGGLIATALALPFPAAAPVTSPGAGQASAGRPVFGWISMVLVHPDWRGRGLATRLVAETIGHLRDQGSVAVLDATPAGFPVYRRLGFVPAWRFARYRREAAIDTPGPCVERATTIRPLASSDWPTILAIDLPAFGADRSALLRHLAGRLPSAAWVAERDGQVIAYCLGRDGREAGQLGPLSAPDPGTARGLLAAALAAIAGPVYLDLAERHDALPPWLEARGFCLQRPFTRMVLGAAQAPGDASSLVLMAGPELG